MSLAAGLGEILQVGAGALSGALAAALLSRIEKSQFMLVAYQVIIGFAIGVWAVVDVQWPRLPLLGAVAFFMSAAPITLALSSSQATIRSISDARGYLARSLGAIVIHVAYGVAAGLIGFAVSFPLALVVIGDVT